MGRAREGVVDVAVATLEPCTFVALPGKQLSRVGAQRLYRVDDDAERFVFDVDARGGVLGEVLIIGDDDRDRLSDVKRAVLCGDGVRPGLEVWELLMVTDLFQRDTAEAGQLLRTQR